MSGNITLNTVASGKGLASLSPVGTHSMPLASPRTGSTNSLTSSSPELKCDKCKGKGKVPLSSGTGEEECVGCLGTGVRNKPTTSSQCALCQGREFRMEGGIRVPCSCSLLGVDAEAQDETAVAYGTPMPSNFLDHRRSMKGATMLAVPCSICDGTGLAVDEDGMEQPCRCREVADDDEMIEEGDEEEDEDEVDLEGVEKRKT